jgi:Flp pilus assembly protein TadD
MKNSVCYFFDRRLSEAERAFRRARGLTPNSIRAHAGLVTVYKQMGNDSGTEKEQRS